MYSSQLAREEGLRGFYRGLVPHLVGVIPSRSISFFTYGNTKSFLCDNFNMPKDSATSSVIAGVAAGFVVVTVTQPIWLVKTRMQLQTNTGELLYKNSIHAIQRIYKEEGMRTFYRGMTASYVGISESTFQFVLYERFKSIVQEYTGRGASDPFYEARSANTVSRLFCHFCSLPSNILIRY
jgi:solute carrier family 25 protein 33/36